MAIIIDGRSIAESVYIRLKHQVESLERGLCPHLSVIQIGNDQTSNLYIKVKREAAAKVGIRFTLHHFKDTVSIADLRSLIQQLNEDRDVHGILIQLPLPAGFSPSIVELIDPAKDVDSFHPMNRGQLMTRGAHPLFIPCTPRACIELVKHIGMDLCGKTAVVIGRSNIVGLPVANLLISYDATVTVCHSKTSNVEAIVKTGDIVVVAIGVPKFVKGSWLKQGAVVIDVGINHIPDEPSESGYRLVGDVDFDNALSCASAISPVPGGVGPVTVAMLMDNTIRSALNFTRSNRDVVAS